MIVIGRILCISTSVVATLFGTLLLKNAIATGSSECTEFDFPCEDGGCVDSGLWCDSNEDCSDGSDEKYCKNKEFFNPDPNRCPSDYFRCNNGPCIPLVGRCDGLESCEDSSDEENCEHYHTTTQATVNSATSAFEGSNAARFFLSLNSSENSVQIKPFSRLTPSDFSYQREIARKWIFSQRRGDYGWGEETPRALTALYLSDEQPIVRSTESDMVMIKQLEIQLFLELAKNGTKPMKLTDLALYINALLVSCKDTKNFYGDNLVQALRDSVNAAQMEGTFVNPSIYLTLCINNATIYDDIKILQDIFSSRKDTIDTIDIQALALLTTSCIFRRTNLLNTSMYDNFKMEFLRNIKVYGFPGNVYEAALLIQALQEIKVTLTGLTDFILKQQQAEGSFGDVLSTYLVMPTLVGKNMLQINDHCGQRNESDLTPTEVLKHVKSKKMQVQYSLNYDFPLEVQQTIHILAAERTNFLDIMMLAQEINTKYRFKRSENRKVPVIYSIGEMPNDAEKGMYWTLYKASKNSNETAQEIHWVPYIGDVKQLILEDGDKVLFWYRPL